MFYAFICEDQNWPIQEYSVDSNLPTIFTFRYSEFRLINVEQLVVNMPLTIAEFARLISQSSTTAVQHLKDVWIPECARLISNKREDVESWMPQNEVCYSALVAITILYKTMNLLDF